MRLANKLFEFFRSWLAHCRWPNTGGGTIQRIKRQKCTSSLSSYWLVHWTWPPIPMLKLKVRYNTSCFPKLTITKLKARSIRKLIILQQKILLQEYDLVWTYATVKNTVWFEHEKKEQKRASVLTNIPILTTWQSMDGAVNPRKQIYQYAKPQRRFGWLRKLPSTIFPLPESYWS